MRTPLILFFFVISGLMYGQITITYDDYANAFAPGSFYKSYMTPFGDPVSVFIGEASDNAQYWDFSTYTFDYISNSVGVEPSTAPFYSTFPSTNFALLEKGWYMKADTITLWNYKEITATEMSLIAVTTDTSLWLTYDPPALQAVIPLGYGASWNSVAGTAVVDAFGTMKLPSGEYECLRVTWDNIVSDYWPELAGKSASRSHLFYSKDIAEVKIFVPEDQYGLTTVSLSGFAYSIREGSSGIAEKNNSTLLQNHPNPCGDQTKIQYVLKSQGQTKLSIYDMTGREIAIIVNELMETGNHEAEFSCRDLPAGIYALKLTCGNQTDTKKMIIKH